ncbi:hypothetical protein C8Q77DRAFT_1062283 [Trametes polyzona]|nr:hypothetical protein C8Q77DRAFT_1062283 [Trametes polyzona]
MVLGDPNEATEDSTPDDAAHYAGTVLGRIRQLERAIVELSESVSDPDAARPVIVRHEAAVNTSPEPRPMVEAGVGTAQPETPAQQVNTGVQVDLPMPLSQRSHSVLPRPFLGIQSSLAALRTHHRVSSSPFAIQPLAPAHWSPQGVDSDDVISSTGSKQPSPTLNISAQTASNANNQAVSVPSSSSEGRGSSPWDEKEILETLGTGTEPEVVSQASATPPVATLPQTSPAGPSSRSVPPIPRTTMFARPSADAKTPGTPLCAPPGQTVSSSPDQAANQSQPKSSPPIPRRQTMAAMALAAGAIAASNSATTTMMTAATMMASRPQPSPPLRSVPPIPRGLGTMAVATALGLVSSSASSSSSSSSPSRPALSPAKSDAFSLSSLSTLSSTSSAGQAQPTTDTSPEVPSGLSSRDVGQSASISAAPSREGTVRGRGRGRGGNRGGKSGTSASARVTVKKERSGAALAGPPAKRRKTYGGAQTVGDDGDGEDATVAPSSTRRGRGGGRGRARSRGGRGGNSGSSRKSSARPGSSTVQRHTNEDKYDPPQIGTDCPWPAKIEGDEAYQREFVQCDSCDAWYHFGCVGLLTNDPRLEPDAEFICPPCESSAANREQRQGLKFKEAACMRPDCDRAGLAEDTNEYFVERIIGRRPYEADVTAGVEKPSRFLWLVKWDGWKADQASWTEREHLGDCARFIEEFEEAAEIEGRDLNKLHEVIVLNEGLAAGW